LKYFEILDAHVPDDLTGEIIQVF